MNRRAFLQGLGLVAGGLTVGAFDLRGRAAATTSKGLRANVFVHVAADGLVTIVCARSEMGQGVRSSLPHLIAEELGADPARIQIIQGDGNPAYGNQNTDGSSSVRGVYDQLRQHGAVARAMLVSAAATEWKVPASDCEARDHAVFHGGKTLGFGALADAAGRLSPPKSAKLRPRTELGKHPMPLVDGKAMVTGRAVYGADVRLPGMLVAVIARPPVVGGKALRYDISPALKIPGVVRVIERKSVSRPYGFHPLGGVAVVAKDTWAALRGRAALNVTWQAGSNGDYDSARFREALSATVNAPCKSVRSRGKIKDALAAATKRVVAEYHTPHLAHVPMEPPAAVARFERGGCEIWAPTQDPDTARGEVAQALGIATSRVTVHVTFLGGAFGRKSKPDFIVEAALLARELGVPVRVQWTREDDIQHDYFHTTATQRLEAGIDAAGKVTAWLHRTAFPSISSTFMPMSMRAGENELQQGVLDVPLDIPNVEAEVGHADAKVRIGWLRSVCNIHHAFAVSSFLDELAHARGLDPRTSLLELYGPARKVTLAELGVDKLSNYGASLDEHPIDVGRMRQVVERVTAMSNWATRSSDGKKRGYGLAAHRSFLTYVAVVVAVTRKHDKLVVDEAWVVADAGILVNRDRVRSQLEGAVIFGISLAFHGAITFRNGAVEQSNFHDFKVARIGEAPSQIHTELVESDHASGGIGEPGVPPVAPAIANAVFALTAKRVRNLPIQI